MGRPLPAARGLPPRRSLRPLQALTRVSSGVTGMEALETCCAVTFFSLSNASRRCPSGHADPLARGPLLCAQAL